jgi:uncharacterized membrane protein YfcA
LFYNALAGLLVGFLVGLTGMGGSSLMAPILIFLFHFKAKYAVGSDLAYGAIAKMFGSYKHYKAGTVDIKMVWQLALGSLPASLVGVWALHSLDKRNGAAAEHMVTVLLGAAMMLVAAILFFRSIPNVEEWFEVRQAYVPRHSLAWCVAVGIAGGFLVGLTSIGGGTLFGVALILIFGMKPKQTVGTDIFHGCLLASVAAIGHVFAGDVNYGLVGGLLIGAIPGVLIGSSMSAKLPDKALRPALATVLILLGMKTIGWLGS